jgi:hypothetical protein
LRHRWKSRFKSTKPTEWTITERAKQVTGQLAAAISEEWVLVEKVRHERGGKTGKEGRARQEVGGGERRYSQVDQTTWEGTRRGPHTTAEAEHAGPRRTISAAGSRKSELDGRDAVAVAVQQGWVGADGDADEGHVLYYEHEALLLAYAVADERDDDEDDGSYWWWQSEAGKPEKFKAPQWEVLAANPRAGWEAGLPKEVKERRERE